MAAIFRSIIDGHAWRRYSAARAELAAGAMTPQAEAALDAEAPGWRQDGHRRRLNVSVIAVLDFWDARGRPPKRCDIVNGQDLGIVFGNYRQRYKRGALPGVAVELLDRERPEWRRDLVKRLEFDA